MEGDKVGGLIPPDDSGGGGHRTSEKETGCETSLSNVEGQTLNKVLRHKGRNINKQRIHFLQA